MHLSVATWNINSVRLREALVCRFLREYVPDVLCLQEIKSPDKHVITNGFDELGYSYRSLRGEKSYNGVMVLSRIPIQEYARRNMHGKNEARHIAVITSNGIIIENFYVPAGGDIPDPDENPKFADKLKFLDGMQKWSDEKSPKRTILVGDLNIAPRQDDVWSHRQLLNVVSHTQVETTALEQIMNAGKWIDIARKHIPEGKLYSWWSYRARDWNTSDRGRRLDHIWATSDIEVDSHSCEILREMRGWPRPSDHVPVLATFNLNSMN